jgi:cellulose synthase (UDP-forming)
MEQPVASILFLFADFVTCFSAILFVVSLWRKAENPAPCENSKSFSIDVFVPTYNEDCAMLETTLQHCIAMDCPHKTWLLDDGNRPEIKALAEKLGVEYIARTANTGAKAGNLNNALQHTQGELIAVFDADFRPEKEFLSKLADYFQDENVAIVQVPQSYYNTNSFQHRRLSKNEIYSDQDTFMHLVLPARNNWNASYWIGTNALQRREAIETTGGFPTDSVTEDVLASMNIHGKGWKSIYVDEPLAYGRAPANISEYYVQRLRWAKGAYQILRLHNPLFQKGLSLIQRLFYFSSVSHFLEGVVKIVYYLFPAFFFLFGLVPLYPYPPVIIGMLFYVGITRLILELITRGRTNLIMDDVYSVIKSFIYLQALPALFSNKKIQFRVTPKDGRKAIAWQEVVGPATVFGCNLAAIIAAAINPYMVESLGVLGWICLGWCLYMGGIAIVALRLTVSG